MKKFLVTAALISIPAPAFADDAQVAKDMLVKAQAAIKADREVALGQFNRGQFNRNGLYDAQDLYPFCMRLTDGKILASPALVSNIGIDARDAKDANGKPFGKELHEGMSKPEGVITEVTYLYPKMGTKAPALPKTTLVMRVAPDLGCGVGYYK